MATLDRRPQLSQTGFGFLQGTWLRELVRIWSHNVVVFGCLRDERVCFLWWTSLLLGDQLLFLDASVEFDLRSGVTLMLLQDLAQLPHVFTTLLSFFYRFAHSTPTRDKTLLVVLHVKVLLERLINCPADPISIAFGLLHVSKLI